MTEQRLAPVDQRHSTGIRKPGSTPQAHDYLRSLRGELVGRLWLTRGVSALHSLMLVASAVLLAWWVTLSIDAGALQGAVLFWVVMAMLARAGLNALAGLLDQGLGEKAEAIARDRLAQSWCQAESGAASATTERATLMVEPAEQLYGYYARFLPQLSTAVVTPLLIALVVLYFDWIAALFLIAAAPIIPIFMVLVGMGAARLNQQHIATTQRIAGLFVDRVRHLTNLQLFKATELATGDIARASDDMRKANMATLRIAFLSSAVLEFFAAVAIAAIAIYVGFSLLGFYDWGPAGQMNLFTGLTVLLLAPEFFQPLRNLSAHYHDRAAAIAAAGLLGGELKAERGLSSPLVAAPSQGALKVNNLTFAYPGAKPVLENFSLTLMPGQIGVLQGPSGYGKSTLLKILSGQLVADDTSIHLPASSHIAYMAQQPYLEAGTVGSNLRLIRAEATDSEIRTALEQAQLSIAVDYQIMEQGQGLSGGEQRRLALARMFLHPAPLMLFDEPTAGLDAHTAEAVIAGIRRLNDGQRILLLASHDPQVQALADVRVEAMR